MEDAPAPLARIRTILGRDLPQLDERVIGDILLAFDLPHAGDGGLASPVDVWRFLRRHEGAAAFLMTVAASSSELEAVGSAVAPRTRWEMATGVAGWRERVTARVDANPQPVRLGVMTATGLAFGTALLIVAADILAVDVPGIALALGAR